MRNSKINKVHVNAIQRSWLRAIFLFCFFVVVFSAASAQNSNIISGMVTDTSKVPIIGASVIVKGTNMGAITDVNGRFQINAFSDATLIFSFLGYKIKEIILKGEKTVNVTLIDEFKSLEEVVVVGYGIQKKSSITGAISQIKTGDIQNRTITQAAEALQGKTVGVQVVSSSGSPGSSPTVHIRGISSNGSSAPLYIVDGLRTSDIGSLDPSNIASMEVLKDAASAAIYGAEAGNGVILITTKTGKAGSGKIMYDFQATINSLSNLPKVMNAREYATYMKEGGLLNDTQLAYWDGKTDTKWADVAFEDALMYKHNLSYQGGGDKGGYFFSISNLSNDGIVRGSNDKYSKLSGMINVDYKIKSWLKVGANVSIERWTKNNVAENTEYGGLVGGVLMMDPLTPAYYSKENLPDFMQAAIASGYTLLTNSDSLYYGLSRYFQCDQIHPLLNRDAYINKSNGMNMMGTAFSDFTPIKGLTITSRLGFSGGFTNARSYTKVFYASSVKLNTTPTISRTATNTVYYQWENFANYHFNIRKHDFTTMVGMAYSDNTYTYEYGSGYSMIKDDILFADLSYLTSDATKTLAGTETYTRKLSYFGRLSYSFRDKYMLQASVRRDAADLGILPSDRRWGTFPAFSAGYVISNESFFPKTTPIAYIKLRGSWGQNGSLSNLGSYQYNNSITSSGSYSYDASGAANYTIASYPNQLSNPDLKWETSEQLDLGLDIRACKERLAFSFDYFDKKTKDLITSSTPPLESGNTGSPINAGNVSNKGLEFELGWTDHMGALQYSIKGNIATLKNMVTYLNPTISRIDGATVNIKTVTAFEKGYPVWYFRGYKTTGIDPATGEPVFVDTNDDGLINDNDKTKIGSGIPKYNYGLTLNLSYKGFDLTVFGSGAGGNQLMLGMIRTDRPTGNRLETYYSDRWTSTNTNASRPRPNCNNEALYWQSDGVIFSGNYFKIKQIQLGYNIPNNIVSKLAISSLRIYASLDDWFTFTKYPGMDPEASSNSTNSIGLDKGFYPNSKKVVFGLSVSF
jgi:TonB-dependent starch-binding outer membrane protein SusC